MIILQHRFPRSQVPRYICRFSYFFFLNLAYAIAVQLAHTAPVVTVVASSPSQFLVTLLWQRSAAQRSDTQSQPEEPALSTSTQRCSTPPTERQQRQSLYRRLRI
eukprot:384140-Pleurochrysis_carterae.AAC.2